MTLTAPERRPPLTAVRFTGFQSLHDVELDLAPYTVIVGPSSSGKSAFVRALRTLTTNSRGLSWLTATFKRASLGVELSDGTTVILHRSPSTARADDNAYIVRAPERFDAPEEIYSKLGGEVPEEIRALLPFGDTALHFASQFDKPYLLDASPQEVSRALAALTNVHVVLAAAREANRRALSSSASLRVREEDLQGIKARLPEFATLKVRRSHLARATTLHETALALRSDIEALSALCSLHEAATGRLRAAEDTLRRYRSLPDLSALFEVHKRLDAVGSVIRALEATRGRLSESAEDLKRYGALPSVDPLLVDFEKMKNLAALIARLDAAETSRSRAARVLALPVPSLSEAEDVSRERDAFVLVLRRLKETRSRAIAATDALTAATAALSAAEDDYASALASASVCPTCGQGTAHITAHDLKETL